ncbi:hypothetical protein BDB00DRAFT_836816 [Zychaea mexicana]|uniref:uncharacterized protein n=1 Tax=Zychaea mexicana TaxID=64656 RepID=UPI0022FEAC0C|nr:uncharacterized protein BDB00DRAFT_836816 [Zychaea mexicana]KAI9490666.1 hypothetical protein BDB00DRAFT_836816 [Zychaea mexicana]
MALALRNVRSKSEVLLALLQVEKGLSDFKNLHITVARVRAETEVERHQLVSTVETGFHALTAAMEVDPPLGRLDRIFVCNNNFFAIMPAPRAATARRANATRRANIGNLRDNLRQSLVRAGFRLLGTKEMHMTFFLKSYQAQANSNNTNTNAPTVLCKQTLNNVLKQRNLDLDLGPLVVTKIQISAKVVTLSKGHHYRILHEYEVC